MNHAYWLLRSVNALTDAVYIYPHACLPRMLSTIAHLHRFIRALRLSVCLRAGIRPPNTVEHPLPTHPVVFAYRTSLTMTLLALAESEQLAFHVWRSAPLDLGRWSLHARDCWGCMLRRSDAVSRPD